MKTLSILTFLFILSIVCFAQIDNKPDNQTPFDEKIQIEDKDKNSVISKMPIIHPDSTIDFQILTVKPDTTIDYTLRIKKTLIEISENKEKSFLNQLNNFPTGKWLDINELGLSGITIDIDIESIHSEEF